MNQKNAKILIGVDEAGRGCLAGPVVSASVAIYEDQIINGVNDSKLLSPKKREILYDVIHNECLSSSIKSIDNQVIDEKNILVDINSKNAAEFEINFLKIIGIQYFDKICLGTSS